MTKTGDRLEAMKRRDLKRMTKAEMSALSAALRLASKSLDEAARLEAGHTHHPAALKLEELAEAQLDAAILYFANIRSRAQSGPTMCADGSIR